MFLDIHLIIEGDTMDNAVFRTRIQTNPYSTKKRYGTRNRLTYKERLGIQTAVCLLILMLAGIIRNADTGITRNLSEKIGTYLSVDMDIKQLISPFAGFITDSLSESSSSASQDDIINPMPENIQAEDKKTEKNTDAAATSQDTAEKGEPAAAAQKPSAASASSPTTTAIKYPGIFITPAAGTLGSPFGDTIDQLTQKTKSHKGLDIEAPSGTEIKAAADGIVLESSFEKTLGYYVKIEHSNGYTTIYGQCSQLIAQKGQSVKQGDLIAKVGSTGASAGTHLHFEIWKDGKAINPIDYIKVTAK